MATEEYKSHHFVPVTYQKRWANETGKVIIYNKETGKDFSDIPKNHAQKNNFYTIQTPLPKVNPKTLEIDIFPIFEKKYADVMSRTFDQNDLPTKNEDINALVNFMIVQGSRTKKASEIAKFQFDKMNELEGRPKDEMEKNLMLAASILKFLPSTINKVNLDILIAPKNHSFITSDHPSSMWFKDGANYHPYEYSIIDLKFNDRYVLCPFSPKYCGMIRMSSLIDNGMLDKDGKFTTKNIPYQFININEQEMKVINKMIIRGADKILILKDKDDLKYI